MPRSACFLSAALAVGACGRVDFDALGDGGASGGDGALPANAVVELSSGGHTSCARTAGGAIWCWGRGAGGRLGDGGAAGSASAVPVPTTITSGAKRVVVGDGGACAILAPDDALVCWGQNDRGQTGGGDVGPVLAPRATGLTDVVDVAISTQTICAVHGVNTTVECAGALEYLGTGELLDRHVFAPIAGFDFATAITGGDFFFCVLKTTGDIACWGDDDQGQLGDGTLTNTRRVSPVPGPVGPYSAIAAGDTHACALEAGAGAGKVDCWGSNGALQLGDGNGSRGTAALVFGVADAVAVECASQTSYARRADGSVVAWGGAADGLLGDGQQTTNRSAVLPVAGLPPSRQISSRTDVHACALAADHTVRCWGANTDGELGRGTFTAAEPTPDLVIGLP